MNYEKFNSPINAYAVGSQKAGSVESEIRQLLTLAKCMERLAGLVVRMSENNGMANKIAEDIVGYEPEKSGPGLPEATPMPTGAISRFNDLLDDLQRAIDVNASHLGRVITRLS